MLEINQSYDWDMLSQQGLNRVVDPMVLRCGEQFLKSRTGVSDADKTWKLLDVNIASLQMFFDILILAEHIPVFDYADTFDMMVGNLDNTLFLNVNNIMDEEVLCDVRVRYIPYFEVKDAAIAELTQLLIEGPNISENLATSILDELANAEYEWSPGIQNLENQLDEDEVKLARFLLGGLIFGGYARKLGGEHIMQPKRSRLFAAAALRAQKAEPGLEEELFAELRRRCQSSSDDLPWQPTLFPYLLSKAKKPSDMLPEIKRLRKTAMVKDYRGFLAEAMDDFDNNGHISQKHRSDLQAVIDAIDRHGKGASPEVKLKFILFAIPAIEVGLTDPLKALWGWSMSQLPGRRHRKLLTRMALSDAGYPKISRRIKRVWSAALQ